MIDANQILEKKQYWKRHFTLLTNTKKKIFSFNNSSSTFTLMDGTHVQENLYYT